MLTTGSLKPVTTSGEMRWILGQKPKSNGKPSSLQTSTEGLQKFDAKLNANKAKTKNDSKPSFVLN
jgi:hypothetical protein